VWVYYTIDKNNQQFIGNKINVKKRRTMMFGRIVRDLRVKNNLSLRQFCIISGEDFGSWSKIERGVLKPPQDQKRLRKIAKILNITEGSDQYKEFIGAAAADAGRIPEYIMNSERALKMMPIFFRTIGGGKPTKEELEEIYNQLLGDTDAKATEKAR
jgi:transcriptional regulator with XRE-family HTH domain